MAEYLYNAWFGWTGYTDNGKLPALLMAVLFFLWFGTKQKGQRALLVYASAMTACCILPVTAAGLMLYQTKFYHYEWIWSLVPVTAVTAFGLAVIRTECLAGNAGQRKKALPVTLLMLAALLLCGSLGKTAWDREARKEERTRAYAVVGQLSGMYPGEGLCLWAPREIMEYAREKDAGILLPYGRNIWDGFLNAYSYDIYNEDTVMLEQWMENLDMTGEADMAMEAALPEAAQPGNGVSDPAKQAVTLEECVAKALEQGVNCIMITGESSDETLTRMETALGTGAQVLEGYYLFVIRQGGPP